MAGDVRITKSPVGRLQLPPSLTLMLTDGRHGNLTIGDSYAPWTPPPMEWIDENRSMLCEAAAYLRQYLEPAPEEFVREVIAKLAALKPTMERCTAEWKLLAAEYVRLLRHYPADIWQSVYDEWVLSSRFFPDASELQTLMVPKLAERKTQLARIEKMLGLTKTEQKNLTPEERRTVGPQLRQLATLLKTGEMWQMTKEQAWQKVYQNRPNKPKK